MCSFSLRIRLTVGFVGRRVVIFKLGVYAKPLFVHASDSTIKMGACQMGIAFRHFCGLVAQHFTDGQQACPVHCQVTGSGMSQIVKPKVFDA